MVGSGTSRARRRPQDHRDGHGLHQSGRVSRDGHRLATGSSKGLVQLWDLEAPDSPPRHLPAATSTIMCLTISPDDRLLAAGCEDGVARVWDLRDLDAAPLDLRGHEGLIYSLAFDPAGRRLLTGASDATARVWDLDHVRAEPVPAYGGSRAIFAFTALSKDARSMISAYKKDRIFCALSGPAVKSTLLPVASKHDIFCVAISDEGESFVLGGQDGTAEVWDVKDGEPRLRGQIKSQAGSISRDGVQPRWPAPGDRRVS